MSEHVPERLPWKDDYLLGYGPMDGAHRDLVRNIDLLLTCADAELADHLDAFAAHARQHFDEEDDWMRKTDFPPGDCHQDEHAAVLKSVDAVRAMVREEQNYAEGRRLAQALADWFPGHAFHLDSALSHWLVKRSHGGKPVVIRRNILAREESGSP